jgi:hypothetical protein
VEDKMTAKFVASKHVPLGFEMIIQDKDNYSEMRIFSHWFNIYLTDNPEVWDDDITFINNLQKKLGDLTTDQRLIRAQMAELCRRHPLFPESIDILCKEIGQNQFLDSAKIGCEGRGLLDVLGFHNPESMKNQRQRIFKRYSASLKKWLAHGDSANHTDSRVFRFLGQTANEKKAFVEKLISIVDNDAPLAAKLKALCLDACHNASVFEEDWIKEGCSGNKAFFPVCCLGCEAGYPEGVIMPICSCCEAMMLDAGLLCTGMGDEKGAIEFKYRRFVEEYILAYANAINSWLEAMLPQYITSFEIDAISIAQRVHSMLGSKNEIKEWLAACLLKTIKANQRWHKRTELIDKSPEVCSWFEKRRKND